MINPKQTEPKRKQRTKPLICAQQLKSAANLDKSTSVFKNCHCWQFVQNREGNGNFRLIALREWAEFNAPPADTYRMGR